MRESLSWRQARSMPKGKERSKHFSDLQKAYGLTENGLRTIANNHRKASGRNDIGAHEAQCVERTVWRALERQAIVGRKQVLKLIILDTSYFKEALADPTVPTRTKRIKY